jgi:hypothetical protein
MKRCIFAALVFVAASAAAITTAGAEPKTATTGRPITPPLVAAIKAAASLKVRDPESLRFERMTRAVRPNLKNNPTDIVCGYFNAKNGLGGYAGAAPFVYFVNDKDFEGTGAGDPIAVPAMLKNFCSGLL